MFVLKLALFQSLNVGTAAEFLSITASGADAIDLVADIDFNGVSFIPQKFQGVFNGNNFTLKNIAVDMAEQDGDVYLGVFSNICGTTTIKNVSIENVQFRYTNYGNSFQQHVFMGCLAGNAGQTELTNVTIKNCSLQTAGSMNARHVGGVLGSVAVMTGSWINLVNTSAILRHMGDRSQNGFNAGGIAGRVGTATVSVISLEFKFSTNAEFVSVSVGGLFGKQIHDVSVDNAHAILNVSAAATRSLHVGGVVGAKQNETKLQINNVRHNLELIQSDWMLLGGISAAAFDGIEAANVLTVLSSQVANLNIVPGSADLSTNCTLCLTNSSAGSLATYQKLTPELAAKYPIAMWSDKDADSLPDVVLQLESHLLYEDKAKKCGCGANANCPEFLFGHITINWCECPASFKNLAAACYPAGCFTADGVVCGGAVDKCLLDQNICQSDKNKSSKLWLIIIIIIAAILTVTALILLIAYLKKKSDKEKQKKAVKGSKAAQKTPTLRALKSPVGSQLAQSTKLANSSGRVSATRNLQSPLKASGLGATAGSSLHLDDLHKLSASGDSGDQAEPPKKLSLTSEKAEAPSVQVVRKVKRVKKSAAAMDAAGLIPVLGSDTASVKKLAKMESTIDLEAPANPSLADQEMGVSQMPHDAADGTAGEPAKKKVKKIKRHTAPDAGQDVTRMPNEAAHGAPAASELGLSGNGSQASVLENEGFAQGPTLSGEELAIDQLDRQFGSMLKELNPRASLRARQGVELTEARSQALRPMKMSHKPLGESY